MHSLFSAVGGRKLGIVLVTILIAVLNDALQLGIDKDTLAKCLLAAVGCAFGIAVEDSVKSLRAEPPTTTANVPTFWPANDIHVNNLLSEDEKDENSENYPDS